VTNSRLNGLPIGSPSLTAPTCHTLNSKQCKQNILQMLAGFYLDTL